MNNLLGVWGAKQTLGPQLCGEITLWKDEGHWHASICGIEVSQADPIEPESPLIFRFPGGAGSFWGRLTKASSRVEGFWIQPPGSANFNSYATPLVLHQVGNIWRGDVKPLDDVLQMYLIVREGADGTLSAFIRDPERNIGLRFQVKEVTSQGDKVHFLTRQG
ncbi:MAG: 6-aminohexanoate hydrolase, partial [Chloroflexota bacterium]